MKFTQLEPNAGTYRLTCRCQCPSPITLNERGTTIESLETPEKERPTDRITRRIEGDEERKAADRIHRAEHKIPLPDDLHPLFVEAHFSAPAHNLAQNLPLQFFTTDVINPIGNTRFPHSKQRRKDILGERTGIQEHHQQFLLKRRP